MYSNLYSGVKYLFPKHFTTVQYFDLILIDSHFECSIVVHVTEDYGKINSVSLRAPIMCQSCLWPQRSADANGSRHDIPLLKPERIKKRDKIFAS